MNTRFFIPMITLPLAMAAVVASSDAQGKGKGKDTDKAGQSQGQGSGKSDKAPTSRGASKSQQRGQPQKAATARAEKSLPASANAAPRASIASAPNRGRAISRFARELRLSEVRSPARRFVASKRAAEYVTGGALAYAFARGAPESALLITPAGRVVSVKNRKGDLLVSLDDDRARNLGVWQVAPLNDRVTGGSPTFCRSGQGHPVWGRQWCLDKGFGLGAQQDVRWGRTGDISDIILGRRVSSGTITRDVLLNLLGDVAFNRLALHAVTLGYTDPLTGRWYSEASGPDVLFVSSGTQPIAELVDTNRDQRADLMLVALRPW
jgi:hypothetical protein